MSSNALALQQSNIIPFPMDDEQLQCSNEWYTPAHYIEAARKVLGTIDLDPASCEMANKTVKATRYYTQEDDCLLRSWYGNVWLNPPYGKTIPYTSHGRYKGGGNTKPLSFQRLFVEKAIAEYESGHMTQAILLVTANTTVAWFQPLWDYPMCTTFPKIRFFVLGSKEKQAQVFGNVFVYLGLNERKFADVFREFGPITKCIASQRHETVQARLWGAV